MRQTIGIVAALALLTGAAAPAGSNGHISVSGDSTLRSWTCEVGDFDATLRTDPATSEAPVIGGLPDGRHQVDVTIPTAGIDCDNGTMNDHLRKALRADKHDEIRFSVTDYAGSPEGVQAQGQLFVAGSTTPITVEAVLEPVEAGVRATGSVDLRMTQLGVEPPKLMFGTLKVDDEIRIEFDVVLESPTTTAAR